MSQPVKLSDALVLDARLAGAMVERSIAGQVEFWARLGRAIEPLIDGTHVMTLCRQASEQPISTYLESVDSPEGRERLAAHLQSQPYPHYEALKDRRGLLIRTESDGKQTVGRFVQRKFRPVREKSSPARP